MKYTGAQILIKALIEQGVENIFGYPGASVLSVYNELTSSPIRHILTAHEQGACFAAEGYSRGSNKTGVVLTTSGPGATNLLTGIADAYMDSIPMVAITGNVSLDKLGHDSFQEVDIFDMSMPITKYSFIIKSADQIAPAVRKAFNIANSGRKGPVLIDIPSNVFEEKAEYEKETPKPISTPSIDESQVDEFVELINKAQRPIIYAGGGVKFSNATKELETLSKKICAPVMVSYMGIGCFNPDSFSYLGVLSNENKLTSQAIKDCDLLIAIGARFNSRYSAFGVLQKKKIPLIQIDLDKAEIDKNVLTKAYIEGDAKQALELVNKKVAPKETVDWSFKDEEDLDFVPTRGIEIIKALSNRLKNQVIVTTDVGLHQTWTAHNFKFYSPKQFLTSGGLGSMGFSMGAAIGAHYATGMPCLVITGDGSFNMNFNELTTAVKNHIPLIIVVMNNNSLGMIRKMQLELGQKQTPASSLYLNIDYAKLAESLGARGISIKETDDINEKLDLALKGKLPVVIDCDLSINDGIN